MKKATKNTTTKKESLKWEKLNATFEEYEHVINTLNKFKVKSILDLLDEEIEHDLANLHLDKDRKKLRYKTGKSYHQCLFENLLLHVDCLQYTDEKFLKDCIQLLKNNMPKKFMAELRKNTFFKNYLACHFGKVTIIENTKKENKKSA